MKVPRVTVGMLEAKAALAKIDFARDTRIDHPLERPVDGRPADSVIFAFDQIDQIVGAQMSLLTEKHVHDLVALARAFGAGGTEAIDVRYASGHPTFRSRPGLVI
jgi:hypothetical protein